MWGLLVISLLGAASDVAAPLVLWRVVVVELPRATPEVPSGSQSTCFFTFDMLILLTAIQSSNLRLLYLLSFVYSSFAVFGWMKRALSVTSTQPKAGVKMRKKQHSGTATCRNAARTASKYQLIFYIER